MILKNSEESKEKIDKIEITSERLTARSGLAFIVRYLEVINLNPLIEQFFGSIRLNKKGRPIGEIFKQLFCYFIDGTGFHITRFDELKKDSGYSSVIETENTKMLTSHQIKRFFATFSYVRIYLFRQLLQKL